VTDRARLSFELDVGRLERGDVAPAQLLVRLRTQVGMEGAERETTERWMLGPALEEDEADDRNGPPTQ
jgi:hypothetical protein